MTLEIITRDQLASDLSLTDANGQISQYTVADLLRTPLARWGLSPKRTVLKHVRDQLRACGIEEMSTVPKVLKRLIGLGECVEVYVGHEQYLAPAEPRWISVGNGTGAYLGVADLPEGVTRTLTEEPHDIVQRIQVEDEETTLLHVAGVREESLHDWLSPIDYLRYANQRLQKPVKSDDLLLGDFWDILETALTDEGLSLSDEAEVRIVTGAPGQFFGRYALPQPNGRWTEVAPDGVWCAYRRGYGETHWHPTLISVDGQERRALDLYDHDEWKWALLARGRKFNSEEVLHTEPTRVQLTFPAPDQLNAALDLLGPSPQAWARTLNPGAPDFWALIQ